MKTVEQLLNKRKLAFKKIELLSKEDSVQFAGTGLTTLSAKIFFDSKSDLVKAAQEIVNKQSFFIHKNTL